MAAESETRSSRGSVLAFAKTANEVLVAFLLAAIIVMGCYTLLLTWPLTQSGAHVKLGAGCAQSERRQFGPYDRLVYALVLEPCQDPTPETPPAVTPIQAGDAVERSDVTQLGSDRLETETAAALASPESRANPEAPTDMTLGVEPRADKPGAELGEDEKDRTVEQTSPTHAQAIRLSRRPNALFLAVLAAGMTGGALYSLRLHTIHVGAGDNDPNWTLWNLSRPFLGGALAVLLFFIIRAGFVQNGQSAALRPEGFIAVGGLVGLFTDQAWTRLRVVAESLFAKDEPETRRRRPGRNERDAPAREGGAGDTPRTES